MRGRPTLRPTHRDHGAAALAELARTAVAAGRSGILTVPGVGADQVGYLDDDGEPLIICPESLARDSSACLAVPAGRRCRVVLGGRLARVDRLHPHLAEVLASRTAHAACLPHGLRSGPVRVVRLCVDAIRVEEDRDSVAVPCTDFASAEPDLWAAFAPAVAMHLNESHAAVLRSAASRRLPDEQVVAVAARRLGRTVLDLDVVTALGASRLQARHGVTVEDPREFCCHLAALVGR